MWGSIFPAVPVSDDDHAAALEQTRAELTSARAREIVALARRLEMPFEIVHETYMRIVADRTRVADRRAREYPVEGAELPMRSTGKDHRPVKIARDEIYEIVVRPQFVAFRPQELKILDGAALWKIHSLRIGNREQLIDTGPIPGDHFNEIVRELKISFETAQTAMDVALLVQYLGDEPGGEMFEAKLIGAAVAY